MSQIQTNSQKKFNKGIALLIASFMTVLALYFATYTHVMLLAVICGIYAYVTKMVPTYFKQLGAVGYAICAFLSIGLPYFFYDVLKNRAIKKGQNVDSSSFYVQGF